jgi:hypothetical protein
VGPTTINHPRHRGFINVGMATTKNQYNSNNINAAAAAAEAEATVTPADVVEDPPPIRPHGTGGTPTAGLVVGVGGITTAALGMNSNNGNRMVGGGVATGPCSLGDLCTAPDLELSDEYRCRFCSRQLHGFISGCSVARNPRDFRDGVICKIQPCSGSGSSSSGVAVGGSSSATTTTAALGAVTTTTTGQVRGPPGGVGGSRGGSNAKADGVVSKTHSTIAREDEILLEIGSMYYCSCFIASTAIVGTHFYSPLSLSNLMFRVPLLRNYSTRAYAIHFCHTP